MVLDNLILGKELSSAKQPGRHAQPDLPEANLPLRFPHIPVHLSHLPPPDPPGPHHTDPETAGTAIQPHRCPVLITKKLIFGRQGRNRKRGQLGMGWGNFRKRESGSACRESSVMRIWGFRKRL